MKFKKNYISSIIVSLLAGFIYYHFAVDIQNSVQDVFTLQDMEINIPDNSEDDLANFKIPQSKKEIAKFFSRVKKKINTESAFNESSLAKSIIDSRAKFLKPVPDRNIDFTAELNNLIKKKNTSSDLNGCKSLREKKVETADLDSRQYVQKSIINKDCFSASINKDYKNGNGFEYNYVYQTNNNSAKTSGKNMKLKVINGSVLVEINDAEYEEDYVEINESEETANIDCDNSPSCEHSDFNSNDKLNCEKEWKVNVKNYKLDKKNKVKNTNTDKNKKKNKDTNCDSNNEIFIEIHSLEDESM